MLAPNHQQLSTKLTQNVPRTSVHAFPKKCDDKGTTCPTECNDVANCGKKYHRDVKCQDQYGTIYTDTSLCNAAGPMPATDYTCAECPTYTWKIGEWKPQQ